MSATCCVTVFATGSVSEQDHATRRAQAPSLDVPARPWGRAPQHTERPLWSQSIDPTARRGRVGESPSRPSGPWRAVRLDTASRQRARRVALDGNSTATERRIAQAAATLVRGGSTLVIAGNALAEAMIPALACKAGLTVITNALNVARRLCVHPTMSGIVLGGWLRRPDRAMVGHLTVQALVDLRADMAFYGASGIDLEHGVTSLGCQDVLTDRQLIGIARTVCILADQQAVGRRGPVRVLPLDAVSTIVTDCGGSECTVERLRNRGMMVIETG